jgi:ribosomal protein L37AE/L43A
MAAMRRKLVWVERESFQGWVCNECAWAFKPSGTLTGKSLDEVKENYEQQRDKVSTREP